MSQNNTIHKIVFTPKKYTLTNSVFSKFLVTLSGETITTLTGKKIKTNG